MMTTQRALLIGALVALSGSASAHGGGLDADGCHHDRKHGGYHCHRAVLSTPRSTHYAPASSQRLTRDTGDSTHYANCSAARAAGAAAVRRCGSAIPGMRGTWIAMAMAWAANRAMMFQRILPSMTDWTAWQ